MRPSELGVCDPFDDTVFMAEYTWSVDLMTAWENQQAEDERDQ